MREFLEREGTLEQNQRSSWQRLEDCGTSMKKLQTAIMASYGGNIESEPDELFKILLVDGCFLLELLMRLRYNSSSSYSNDPVLGNEEKLVSILNDITMLENQIPFIVLKKLYRKVFPHPDGSDIENDHRAAKIVQEAFHYPV
ncbi:UPF0481 protein [Spatholobus suberectus]|nr:UPF0481 protein [Spatholobus suberectus]